MTVLYIILAVVATIAVLLAFALASPLSVRIKYEESLEVFAGLSFVKLKVFPKKQKKKTGKKKKPKASPKLQSTSKSAPPASNNSGSTQKSKSSSLKETLVLVLEIVKSVFDAFGKNAKIEIDMLKVIVSKPDAADTAIQFGLCGGIVSNILAFTSNFRKARVNDKNVFVEPDFITGKSSLAVDITVSITVWPLLVSLIKGYFKGIKKT